MKNILFFLGTLLLLVSIDCSRRSERGLDIYWIDVEGGAATLMVTPAGEAILVDTGYPSSRDGGVDVRRIHELAAKIAGLKRIDHLVVTHFHNDHFGGAAELSELLPIGNHYDYGVQPEDRDDVGEAYMNFKAENRLVLEPGYTLPLRQLASNSPQVSIKCLAARGRFVAPSAVDHGSDGYCENLERMEPDTTHNALSVVLLVRLGDFDFLDAGDLTWNMEEKLVCPANLVGEVDVYQVNHHGLSSSNNPVLIESIQPIVAVINNGETKGCEPRTFATLKRVSSIQAIYQVHKNLRPDGEVNNTASEFIANLTPAAECQGNYIKLSVAPDGKSYTVAVPATGHEETYACK